MFKVSNSTYSLIATAFVLMVVLGYALFTAIILPVASDVKVSSHLATYPYRGLMLVLSLFLIISEPNQSKGCSTNKISRGFVLFMFVYFIRILIDIYVRNVYVDPYFRISVVQYMFLIMIPSIIAAYKCGIYVDIAKLNKWLCIGSLAYLLITLTVSRSLIQVNYSSEQRVDANVALNTISFGSMFSSVSIIFLLTLILERRKRYISVILLVSFLVSFILLLRIGSRGPLVAIIISLLVYLYARQKHSFGGLAIVSIAILILYINFDYIMTLISRISPVMGNRMAATIMENDSSGRDALYANAIDIFWQNPILGKQFVVDIGFYSHNLFLDALIGLGIGGGIALLYFIVKSISKLQNASKVNDSLTILGLLVVKEIVGACFSGALCTNCTLCVLMIVLLSHDLVMNEEYTQLEVNNV